MTENQAKELMKLDVVEGYVVEGGKVLIKRSMGPHPGDARNDYQEMSYEQAIAQHNRNS